MSNSKCDNTHDVFGKTMRCSLAFAHSGVHKDLTTDYIWSNTGPLADPVQPPTDATGNPPQCPSTCYDRAVSADTRCRQPEGHEGPHEDGAMPWGDEAETEELTPARVHVAHPGDGAIHLELRAKDLRFMIHMERDPSESGWNLVRSGVPLGDGGLIMGLVDASELVAVFEKAERAQEYEDDFARVKAEDHAGDEAHCSCVIHLRRHIEELKAEIAAMKRSCQHERTYTTEATICRRCSVAVDPSQPTDNIYCNNCLLPADECKHKTRALSRYTPEQIDKLRRERGPSVHAEDPFEDYVRSLDGVRRDQWRPVKDEPKPPTEPIATWHIPGDGVAKDVTVHVTEVFGSGGTATATYRRPLKCKQHGIYGREHPFYDDLCPKCGSRSEP